MSGSSFPVMDAILARRSVRSFLPKRVERDTIEQLLRAAMAAPSACNLQPWAFVVVDDPDQLARLNAVVDGTYNAPMAVVVCGINRNIPWGGEGWMQECGAAVENMMLAAVEQGMGSVWVGGYDADKLKALLCIPEDVKPMCVAYFGYPDAPRPPCTWYTEEAVYWQRYDGARAREMRTMEMLQEDIRLGRL